MVLLVGISIKKGDLCHTNLFLKMDFRPRGLIMCKDKLLFLIMYILFVIFNMGIVMIVK